MKNYSVFAALVYELLSSLIVLFPSLKTNIWALRILKHCKDDWVSWKTENTLHKVDKQIEQIQKVWASEKKDNKEFIRHNPDGSKAQELLGGTIEIKSKWQRD